LYSFVPGADWDPFQFPAAMQSFLQYRRFGKHVAAQFERDKSKAEALGNADTPESSSPSSSNPEAVNPAIKDEPVHAQDYADSRDPEKGEQSSGNKAPEGTEDYPALDLEKTGDRDGAYEPIRAIPSGRQDSTSEDEANHMSRASTVATKKSTGTALGTALTGINVRDRSTKEGGEGKVFVVGYEGDKDIMDPHNWSMVTRFGAT